MPDGYEHVPMAEIIFMIGFFLVYFIEELVQNFCNFEQHVTGGVLCRAKTKVWKNEVSDDLEHPLNENTIIGSQSTIIGTESDTRPTIKGKDVSKYSCTGLISQIKKNYILFRDIKYTSYSLEAEQIFGIG